MKLLHINILNEASVSEYKSKKCVLKFKLVFKSGKKSTIDR